MNHPAPSTMDRASPEFERGDRDDFDRRVTEALSDQFDTAMRYLPGVTGPAPDGIDCHDVAEAIYDGAGDWWVNVIHCASLPDAQEHVYNMVHAMIGQGRWKWTRDPARRARMAAQIRELDAADEGQAMADARGLMEWPA